MYQQQGGGYYVFPPQSPNQQPQVVSGFQPVYFAQSLQGAQHPQMMQQMQGSQQPQMMQQMQPQMMQTPQYVFQPAQFVCVPSSQQVMQQAPASRQPDSQPKNPFSSKIQPFPVERFRQVPTENVRDKGKSKVGDKAATTRVVQGQPKPQKNAKKVSFPQVRTSRTVSLKVNGKSYSVSNVVPSLLLNDWLRTLPRHKGTKKSCGEGGCGACMVVLSWTDASGTARKAAVNSCLRPLASCDGMEVITVEGIKESDGTLNPISKALADGNGTQCGFCSVGMVMQMYGLLQSNDSPTESDVEEVFDGNICRCTGYRPILESMRGMLKNGSASCCGSASKQKNVVKQDRVLRLITSEGDWYKPTSLAQLLSIMSAQPDATKKFVCGNTSIGVYKNQVFDMWIDITQVSDLKAITDTGNLTIGGAVTISDFVQYLKDTLEKDKSTKTNYIPVLLNHFKKIANTGVRNAGSVAGNLMMEHIYGFVSDIWTILAALGTQLIIVKQDGSTMAVPLMDFQTYDMTNQIIYGISIPWATAGQHYMTYKTMIRHVNSHAIVNAGFRVSLDSNYKVTEQPTLVYGGIQKYAVRATETEKSLVGKSWTDPDTLKDALDSLQSNLVPTVDTSSREVEYRKSCILTFFYQFYVSLLPSSSVPPNKQSIMQSYDRPISSGAQSFTPDESEYPVSKPTIKAEAYMQTSGDAEYIGDISTPSDSLYAAFVLTTVGAGTIESIDADGALACEGVEAFISAADLDPSLNNITLEAGVPEEYLEPLFATDKVLYNGQPIGIILADTQQHATAAAKMVTVIYNAEKPIVDIKDAIKQKSFLPATSADTTPIAFKVGDPEGEFPNCDHVVSGSLSIPAQYHFQMETQNCVAIPQDNELTIHAGTQWPAIVQYLTARVLGKPCAQFNCQVKRLGGAYGSKITRNCLVSVATAVAADILKRPVVAQMDLNSNMRAIGKRHPYVINYTVGYNDDGKVNALAVTAYADAGCSYDSTTQCIDALVVGIDNAYKFDNFSISGINCFTNTPSNTSMRGPGFVPAVYFIEQIFENIAVDLKMEPDKVKEMNFYQEGDLTPIGFPLNNLTLPALWSSIKDSSDYTNRYAAVQTYNSENRWTKRGISIVPTKYAMLWSVRQGCCVSVNRDGSVVINHSGIEMGQGLNTKVLQVAAYGLGIDSSLIHIKTTSTNVVPNADPTGGSVGSGLTSKAVYDACLALKKKLTPTMQLLSKSKPKGQSATWEEVIAAAYASGMDLRENGWTFVVDSNMIHYMSYGAAVTEVLVNVLTGETQVLRADVTLDCGVSLSPLIDLGQVEGAFMQGLGYYLTEELLLDQNTGELLTDGTWEYKPPSALDIPIEFNTSLLPNVSNPLGLLGSKASGEPPYCMSASVKFAVDMAVRSARNDAGLDEAFNLVPPATPAKIQQMCGNTIDQLDLS
eukprot:CAMPEP_0174259192 /NCGR_PEP_ID=MMETSP0439-20130205/8049_1 /TAXON_ID=0 /ORGANISM="Stereomyxa ramosa, Strain Chinc5" /LENGTH=1426 /DNA_ID=CAMNT_0015342987 /DNA_START=78 /DNA_END=4358 /DNA_ORIENTATION=+